MGRLAPYFPGMKPAWTARSTLPGSDFGGVSREAARNAFFARFPNIPQATLRGIFRRHGMLADAVVGDGLLGEELGVGLTEREVRYFIEREWARDAEDVLWRRTKAGLMMSEAQRQRVAAVVAR
jgi:glycerol-3-phosphate dehydrogenase